MLALTLVEDDRDGKRGRQCFRQSSSVLLLPLLLLPVLDEIELKLLAAAAAPPRPRARLKLLLTTRVGNANDIFNKLSMYFYILSR